MQFSYEVRSFKSHFEGYDLFIKDSNDETIMKMELNIDSPETSVENLKLFEDQCESGVFEKLDMLNFRLVETKVVFISHNMCINMNFCVAHQKILQKWRCIVKEQNRMIKIWLVLSMKFDCIKLPYVIKWCYN